jgi:hypothetical protein
MAVGNPDSVARRPAHVARQNAAPSAAVKIGFAVLTMLSFAVFRRGSGGNASSRCVAFQETSFHTARVMLQRNIGFLWLHCNIMDIAVHKLRR